MIELGALTDLVLEHVADETGQLVGDGIAPPEGGWISGQPNAGVFAPYLVLASVGTVPRFSSLDDLTTAILSWEVSFQMRGYGGSRTQVDWVMTLGRSALEGLTHQTFGEDDTYRIKATDWKSLGATTRNDSVDPPFWQVADTLYFLCSRTRND